VESALASSKTTRRRDSEGGYYYPDHFLLYGSLCYIDQEWYDVV